MIFKLMCIQCLHVKGAKINAAEAEEETFYQPDFMRSLLLMAEEERKGRSSCILHLNA